MLHHDLCIDPLHCFFVVYRLDGSRVDDDGLLCMRTRSFLLGRCRLSRGSRSKRSVIVIVVSLRHVGFKVGVIELVVRRVDVVGLSLLPRSKVGIGNRARMAPRVVQRLLCARQFGIICIRVPTFSMSWRPFLPSLIPQ